MESRVAAAWGRRGGGVGAVDVSSRNATLAMTGTCSGLVPADVSFSSQGRGDIVLTPWAAPLVLSGEDRARSYNAQVLEPGLDAMLGGGLTISGAVALVQSEARALTDGAAQTGEGEGTILTLAALYEVNGWTADAALRFSQTEYAQVLSGTVGTAGAEGTSFRASISRAFDLGNGGTLSPTAPVITGMEQVTGIGGGLAQGPERGR